MSAILRISRAAVGVAELGMAQNAASVELAPSRRAIELYIPAVLVSGKEAGLVVEDEVKPNQRITWDFGVVKCREYQAFVSVNPRLLELGMVSCPQVLEPKEETHLRVTLHSAVGGSVSDIDWVIRVYLVN